MSQTHNFPDNVVVIGFTRKEAEAVLDQLDQDLHGDQAGTRTPAIKRAAQKLANMIPDAERIEFCNTPESKF